MNGGDCGFVPDVSLLIEHVESAGGRQVFHDNMVFHAPKLIYTEHTMSHT